MDDFIQIESLLVLAFSTPFGSLFPFFTLESTCHCSTQEMEEAFMIPGLLLSFLIPPPSCSFFIKDCLFVGKVTLLMQCTFVRIDGKRERESKRKKSPVWKPGSSHTPRLVGRFFSIPVAQERYEISFSLDTFFLSCDPSHYLMVHKTIWLVPLSATQHVCVLFLALIDTSSFLVIGGTNKRHQGSFPIMFLDCPLRV